MEGDHNEKQEYFVPIHSHRLWQSEIVPHLQRLSTGECTTNEVIDILMTFNERYCFKRRVIPSYRNKKKTSYQALKDIYDQKLPVICKSLATFLLQFRPQPIPLVLGGKSQSLNYKKKQFVYLIILMFFSLIQQQYCDVKENLQGKFNNLNNMSYILSHHHFKTQCIVQYLKIALKEYEAKQQQILTIVRNVESKKAVEHLILQNKQAQMCKLILQTNDRSIEEFNGQIKTDFANRFIGGGCLTDGCVQQEIMFAVHPQLYATTLLCQKMEDYESLAFIGFKRYFNNKGYGNTTSFEGLAQIEYQVIGGCQIKEYITAIDAIKFKIGGKQQYQKNLIDREIMKAFLGFSALPIDSKIVTGGWGCGVYHGDIQAKLLIQWIAASLVKKQMIFCPFGKKKILEECDLLTTLSTKSIQYVYELLLKSSQLKLSSNTPKQSLYSLALKKLNSKM